MQIVSIDTTRYSAVVAAFVTRYPDAIAKLDKRTPVGAVSQWCTNKSLRCAIDFSLRQGSIELLGFHDGPSNMWAAVEALDLIEELAAKKMLRFKVSAPRQPQSSQPSLLARLFHLLGRSLPAGFSSWWTEAIRIHSKKLRALATKRKTEPEPSLKEYLPAPQKFAEAILEIISGLLPVRHFPIRPDDELWSLFDLEQGCLISEIEDLLRRVAPTAPDFLSASNSLSLETVRDLVLMVYAHAKEHLHNPE